MAHDRRVTQGCREFLRRPPGDRQALLPDGRIPGPALSPDSAGPILRALQRKVAMPKMPEGFLDGMPTNYKHLRTGSV